MITGTLGIVAAAASVQADLDGQLLRAGYVAVPLRASGVGHLHTDGTLDGQAVEVLVDTGASNTVLDIDLARRLGLRLRPSPRSGGGIGSATVEIMLIEGAALTVHGIAVPGPIYAMDMTHLKAALRARGSAVPDVVLGGDAMRALDAVLAYAQDRLFLKPPALR